MIVRVLDSCLQTEIPTYIATDSNEVIEAVRRHRPDFVNCLYTRSDHPNGTSRIAEAARDLKLGLQDIVIDVQGDDPFIEPELIRSVARSLPHASKVGCLLPAVRVPQEYAVEVASNPSIVKLVVATPHDPHLKSPVDRLIKWNELPTGFGRVIGFTRRMNSYSRHLPLFKHCSVIGFYNFCLQDFAGMGTGMYELTERVELYRLLEMNNYIFTMPVDSKAFSVDTPNDLERARAYAKELEL